MAAALIRIRQALIAVTLALAVAGTLPATPTLAQGASDDMELVPPAQGQDNDIEMWRAVRGGVQGTVSIPDKQAGVLVQSEGEAWRSIRNGPMSTYGSWLMLGTLALLAAFFAYRGRIRISAGRSGRLILRFPTFERVVHWITAVTFILLGLTGLNMLYGRYVLLPLLSADGFAALTMAGKVAHNYLGFLFIACLVVMFLMWIRHNIPTATDIRWLARGGGMIGKDHPPADKFNAGQKIVFAAVIIVGAIISYTGLSLIYPFAFDPTVQGMQFSQLVHTGASLVLIALIFAHIYIGTVGMEGAIDAMWSGYVDENWAREHHSLWVEKATTETEPAPTDAEATPAE